MFKLLKEFLSILILKYRHETLRQCCYDAVAYAVEKAAQHKGSFNLDDAVMYLTKSLPGISEEDAVMYIESLSAKLDGVGAQPDKKV